MEDEPVSDVDAILMNKLATQTNETTNSLKCD